MYTHLPLPKESFDLPVSVAVDTTYLLCANSALLPSTRSERRDFRCDETFTELMTYVCNGRDVHCIRPGVDIEAAVPLMALVPRKTDPTLKLKPTGVDATYRKVANDFCLYMTRGVADRVAAWVAFQLDDDLLEDIFFQPGVQVQTRHLSMAFDHLRRTQHYNRLTARWRSEPLASLPILGRHAQVARRVSGNASEYRLAYAFYGYAKGLFYSRQLLPELRRRTLSHWLRDRSQDLDALPRPRGNELGTVTMDPLERALWFRWGDIILDWGRRTNATAFMAHITGVTRAISRHSGPGELRTLLAGSERYQRRRLREFVGDILGKAAEEIGSGRKLFVDAIDKVLEELGPHATTVIGPDGFLAVSAARVLNAYVSPRLYDSPPASAARRFVRGKLLLFRHRDEVSALIDDFLHRTSAARAAADTRTPGALSARAMLSDQLPGAHRIRRKGRQGRSGQKRRR